LGFPINPSRDYVLPSSPDINAFAIIGEVGLCILESRTGNGDRLLSTGRRVVDRVLVFVSGRRNDGDAAGAKLKAESLVSGVAVTFHLLSAYRVDGLVHGVGGIAGQA